MKIKIKKERENSDYYDEFIYIQTYCRKFIKNPNRTTKLLTKDYRNGIIIGSIVLIWSLLLIIFAEPGLIIYVSFGALIVAILIFIALLINAKQKLKFFLNNSEDGEVVIDKDIVQIVTLNQSYKAKWEDIKWVVANHYSIAFLPAKLPGFVFSIPLEYKDELVKSLKKVNKEDLFVDNSEYY